MHGLIMRRLLLMPLSLPWREDVDIAQLALRLLAPSNEYG
jgi:hypothetical protein